MDERGLRERVVSTFCSTEVHMKIVISEGAARLISDGCCIARTERKRETYYLLVRYGLRPARVVSIRIEDRKSRGTDDTLNSSRHESSSVSEDGSRRLRHRRARPLARSPGCKGQASRSGAASW